MAYQTRSAGFGQNIAIGAGRSWGTPTNIYASDDAHAGVTLNVEQNWSHYLRATNFGFSIPAGTTIAGIKVEIEKKAPVHEIVDYSVKIVKAGAESGTEKKIVGEWPSSDTYVTYGGSTDKWGLTWTSSDINQSNFGVSISALFVGEAGQSSAYVDHVRITVYYIPVTNMNIKASGAWKDAAEIKIKASGAWKPGVKAWQAVSGAWRVIF